MITQQQQVLKEVKKEAARAEILDDQVMPLEKMRHEMKGLMLEAQAAMLDADLPKRLKADGDIPYYYGANSWQNQGRVPWNEVERRALTPAEGIRILAGQRDEARGEAATARKRLESAAQN